MMKPSKPKKRTGLYKGSPNKLFRNLLSESRTASACIVSPHPPPHEHSCDCGKDSCCNCDKSSCEKCSLASGSREVEVPHSGVSGKHLTPFLPGKTQPIRSPHIHPWAEGEEKLVPPHFSSSRGFLARDPFHFGNSGMIPPPSRVELTGGLSLYEQLFLRKYMSPTAVQKALVKGSNNSRRKILASEGADTVSYPDITHHLFANQNAHTPLAYCRPTPFDEGRSFANKSERERFRRITTELAILREKMRESPDKSQILALAIIDKYFGKEELDISEKHLASLIAFIRGGDYSQLSSKHNVLQVIINALVGNYDRKTATVGNGSVSRRMALKEGEEPKFGATVEKFREELLGNSIYWENCRRERKVPESIPKITTQAKSLNRLLGNILEARVGTGIIPSLKKKKLADFRAAQNLKASISKNRLVLEQVLHERSLKRLKRRDHNAKLRTQDAKFWAGRKAELQDLQTGFRFNVESQQ